MPALRLLSRQEFGGSGCDDMDQSNCSSDNSGDLSGNSWWWSPTAYAVKWAIIAGIVGIFFLSLFLAYLHARRRLRKGLQPLPYHQWLVTRRQRANFEPQNQNDFSFYRTRDGHLMNDYAAPPPAYNAEHDYVPAYSPPEGATKVKPNQNFAAIPPPGPPPNYPESGPSEPPRVASRLRP